MKSLLLKIVLMMSALFPIHATTTPTFKEQSTHAILGLSKAVIAGAHIAVILYASNAILGEMRTLSLGGEWVDSSKRKWATWEALSFALTIPSLFYVAFKLTKSSIESFKKSFATKDKSPGVENNSSEVIEEKPVQENEPQGPQPS